METLSRAGLQPLGDVRVDAQVQRIVFEFFPDFERPARTIEGLLGVIEALEGDARIAWDQCLDRRFDLGFRQCKEDRCSRWEIEADLIRRMAALNASIVVTVCRSYG